MNDYHLRCTAADKPQLLALAVELGVLAFNDETGTYHAAEPGSCWVEIGPIYKDTGLTTVDADGITMPVTEPVRDAAGEPYWHANLRLAGPSLMERAEALGGPDIALALTQLPRWFVADFAGNPITPNHPAYVFA